MKQNYMQNYAFVMYLLGFREGEGKAKRERVCGGFQLRDKIVFLLSFKSL